MTRSLFKKSTGFTLIELMITVAIIGILAAIALPAYTEQVRKSRRAEVRTILLEGSQWMERFFTENQRYSSNQAGVATSDANLFPLAFNFSPKGVLAADASYTITLSNLSPNTYTITATAQGSMVDDKCGNYVINQTGARGNTNYSSSLYATAAIAAAQCWK